MEDVMTDYSEFVIVFLVLPVLVQIILPILMLIGFGLVRAVSITFGWGEAGVGLKKNEKNGEGLTLSRI